MLCRACQNMCEGSRSKAPPLDTRSPFTFSLQRPYWLNGCEAWVHHPSGEAFASAVRSGCQLCLLFWHQLSNEERHDISNYSQEGSPNLDAHTEYQVLIFEDKCWLTFQYVFPSGELFQGERRATFASVRISEADEQMPLPVGPDAFQAIGDGDLVLSLVGSWIAACRNDHEACRRAHLSHTQNSLPPSLPGINNALESAWAFARILDVAIPDSNLVRLCEAKDVPHNANYLTLSHCWGGFQPLRLLSANYEAMKKQISWSLLPNTFRDAISFTRKLGERYLWIDSICIIQDSRLDWLRESSVMGRIYQGSYCNLAATSAANSSVGLFTCRDPAFIPPLRLFIPDPSKVLIETLPDVARGAWLPDPSEASIPPHFGSQSRHYYDCFEENLWGREIASSPLCHRAWVLQERLLAPGTLHFASQQLFWECQELQACEKVPRGFLNTTYKRPNPHMRVIDIASQELAWNAVPAPFFQVWEEIVTAYTSADLTKESDKLIAIGGLASILALKSGVRYTAGLWHHDLLRQLLWRVEKPVHRPQNYRAPSWSWASVDGTVINVFHKFPDSQRYEITKKLTILGVQTNAIDGKDTEQVTSAQLHVCGRLLPATLSKPPEYTSWSLWVRGLGHLGVWLDADESIDLDHIFCVPIAIGQKEAAHIVSDVESNPYGLIFDFDDPKIIHGYVFGLVLQASASQGTFRRLGTFQCQIGGSIENFRPNEYSLFSTDWREAGLGNIPEAKDEVDPRYYHSYKESESPAEKGFGSFVFTVI